MNWKRCEGLTCVGVNVLTHPELFPWCHSSLSGGCCLSSPPPEMKTSSSFCFWIFQLLNIVSEYLYVFQWSVTFCQAISPVKSKSVAAFKWFISGYIDLTAECGYKSVLCFSYIIFGSNLFTLVFLFFRLFGIVNKACTVLETLNDATRQERVVSDVTGKITAAAVKGPHVVYMSMCIHVII